MKMFRSASRSGISSYIGRSRNLNYASFFSASTLIILVALTIFPIVRARMDAEAIVHSDPPILTLTTSNIDLSFSVSDTEGSFATSTPASFSVSTNNSSGYTLSIATSTTNNVAGITNTANTYDKLVNSAGTTTCADDSTTEQDESKYCLNSISSASASEEFNSGNWGYLPSKLNSTTNTLYQPAPDLFPGGTVLDTTTSANAENNTYTITLGVKADYSTPLGTYGNSFVLTAIANPVEYGVNYNKNTTDDVEDMPENQSGQITTTDATISSNTPIRTDYTFINWCDTTPTNTNGIDDCTGTVYAPGDTYELDETRANNTLNLYAMWKRGPFTITFDSNTGTGTMADQTFYGDSVKINANTFAKTSNTFASWNTAANNSGTAYADNSTFTVPATGSSITLHAQWLKAVYMQDFAALSSAEKTNAKAVMVENYQYKLKDNRDSKDYYISKIRTASGNPRVTASSDGNKYQIWMTQNLDLDLTTTNKLNSSNTDINSNSGIYSSGYATSGGVISWTPVRATVNNVTQTQNDNATPYSYNPGNVYYYPGESGTAGSSTCNNTADTTSENDCAHWHIGNYYNWSAAVASNNTSTQTANYTNAANSICPKGWQLPTGLTAASGYSDFNYLLVEQSIATNYVGVDTNATWTTINNGGYINIQQAPLYIFKSGNFYSSSLDAAGDNGYLWSSTASGSTGGYTLLFYSSRVFPAFSNSRLYGFPVRCIVRQ